jgi:hypothetical protein
MTGKSFFLSYILVDRLAHGQPTIFLQPNGGLHIFHKEHSYYSPEDVCAQNSNLDSFFKSNPGDWWALLDKPKVPIFLQTGRNPGWTLYRQPPLGR